MSPPSPILTDEDVRAALSMPEAIELIEGVFRLRAEGGFLTPPRFYVGNDRGALAFTVGGHASGGSIGFRVYETFPGPNLRHEQFVAVFDGTTGELKGLVFGELLGAMRTGAIGGVAMKYAAREDARTVGVVGSGMQARTQLMAAAAVRPITAGRIYSRSAEHREAFASEMSSHLGIRVLPVANAAEAVDGAEIVITATSSTTPVLTAGQIGAGVHVNALGPKFAKAYELDPAVADRAAAVFTDSPAQLRGYPEPFFLDERHEISDLADHVAAGIPIRRSAEDITVFCSVGLSGTEVVLAEAVLARAM